MQTCVITYCFKAWACFKSVTGMTEPMNQVKLGISFFCFCVNRMRKLCWIKLISRSGKDVGFLQYVQTALALSAICRLTCAAKTRRVADELGRGCATAEAFALSLKLLLRQLSPNGSSCSEEPPGINTKLLQYKSGWNKCLLAPVGQLARQKAIGYSL